MSNIMAIQMIGTQRSGSNLLRVMLHQLHISAPHPPHIMERFMPLLQMYGNLALYENFSRLVDDVCQLVETNPVSWGNIRLDRKEIAALCNYPELVEIVRVIYELKCQYDKDNIWMCKSMANIHYMDQLEKYLHPYYLFLYRDGRDVALSFKKAIVGEKQAYFLAKQWKEEQDLCLDVYRKLGPKRVIKIKYEDLIIAPEMQLMRICDFLGIKFQKEALNYYQSEESMETAHAGKMWENVQKPVINDNFNKYRKELTQEEIQIFERVAGSTLQALEYELDYPQPAQNTTFTEAEIACFKKENQERKNAAKAQQLDSDKLKRQKQNQLLDRLRNQYNTYVTVV